ncbi:MAG: hypothetical protein ACE5I9_03455 [Candidatus Methylomirabilales bacterium]
MRHTKWKPLGLALFLALLGLQCAPPRKFPSLVKPTQVEVQGARPLVVKVTDMQKRPLRPDELTPPAKAGFFWEYRVKVANPNDMGVTLDRLRLTVQNLWGESWPRNQPLNLALKDWSEVEISVQAQLASSGPHDQASLTGIETLTFLGRRDDGTPVSFTVRVPLD